MKKIAIVLLIMTVLAGTVSAQNYDYDDYVSDFMGMFDMILGMGRSPLGAHSVVYSGHESLYIGGAMNVISFDLGFTDSMLLSPFVGYKMNILDGALDLYGEAYMPTMIDPDFEINMTVKLGAQYNIGLDFGKLYFGLDSPILLLSTISDVGPFDYMGFDFKVGLETEMGFGAEMKIYNAIIDGENTFFDDFIDLTGWYRMDAFVFAAVISLPLLVDDGMDWYGISMTPQLSYSLNDDLKIFGGMPIKRIGSELDLDIGLFAGVTYNIF